MINNTNLRRGVHRRATQNKTPVRGVVMTVQSNTPPQIRSNVLYTHLYRFTSDGTTVAPTANNLLTAAGVICTSTNSLAYAINASVKVNHIEIWSPPASQGTFATCSINWASSLSSSNNKEISDTSVSVTTPAHVKTGPPLNSLARFWQTANTSAVMFTMVAPSGSIIDVSLSLVMSDDDTEASPFNVSIATGVVGKTYYLALDGPSNNHVIPVSLTTTH